MKLVGESRFTKSLNQSYFVFADSKFRRIYDGFWVRVFLLVPIILDL